MCFESVNLESRWVVFESWSLLIFCVWVVFEVDTYMIHACIPDQYG